MCAISLPTHSKLHLRDSGSHYLPSGAAARAASSRVQPVQGRRAAHSGSSAALCTTASGCVLTTALHECGVNVLSGCCPNVSTRPRLAVTTLLSPLHTHEPHPTACLQPRCQKWAQAGECESNPGYMMSTCGQACGSCSKSQPDTDPSAASVPEEEDDTDDPLQAAEQDLVRSLGTAAALNQMWGGEQAGARSGLLSGSRSGFCEEPHSCSWLHLLGQHWYTQRAKNQVQTRCDSADCCIKLPMVAWFSIFADGLAEAALLLLSNMACDTSHTLLHAMTNPLHSRPRQGCSCRCIFMFSPPAPSGGLHPFCGAHTVTRGL